MAEEHAMPGKKPVRLPDGRNVYVDEKAYAKLGAEDLRNAYADVMNLIEKGKAAHSKNEEHKPELTQTTNFLIFLKDRGIAYPEVREFLKTAIERERSIQHGINRAAYAADVYGRMNEKKRSEVSFQKFADLAGYGEPREGYFFEPKGFEMMHDAGLDKRAHYVAAGDAIGYRGVPAEFIVSAARNGIKLTNAQDIAKTHAWSAHFPLAFLKSNGSAVRALPEERLVDAEHIGSVVKDPAVKLQLLQMGAAPLEVAQLAPHFAQEKLPELVKLAREHGASAGDIVKLKQEGVQQTHFGDVLGAVREVGDKERGERLNKAIADYSKGLTTQTELVLAHQLRSHVMKECASKEGTPLDEKSLPGLVQLGLKEGLKGKLDVLHFLDNAARETGARHRDVLAALRSMERGKIPAAHEPMVRRLAERMGGRTELIRARLRGRE